MDFHFYQRYVRSSPTLVFGAVEVAEELVDVGLIQNADILEKKVQDMW